MTTGVPGVIAELCSRRVIPVVVIEDADDALPLGRALVDGGLPVAEVTLRTPAALAALRVLAQQDGMLVGAGTVVRASQVDEAVAAGARYVVSPGFNASVVRRCAELDIPVLPGVTTATEVMAALEHGLDTLKFFPAGAAGGAPVLTALSAPFGDVRFVPTGGVSLGNLAEYLALRCVAAVGGTWLTAPEIVARKDFGEVARRASEAVAVAEGVSNG